MKLGAWILFLVGVLALPLDGQQAKHIPVDREIGDEEVLRLVNRRCPGLEDFAAAMEAGDLTKARLLLVKHFATRRKPVVPPAAFPGAGAGNSMMMLPTTGRDKVRADATWMKHIFTLSNNDVGKRETYALGPQIDWLHSPSKGFSWGLYLNQLNVPAQLAGVHRGTGEEKYAREIGELLVSWTRQVHRGYGYTKGGRHVNSGMEVRNRLCNCIAAYDVVRKSPSLTPEMHMAFWKVFIACSRELMSYRGVSYPGLMAAAVMFPEFAEAEKWMEAGRVSLRNSLVERVTPEGGWDTHSISYQTVPVPWAERVLEFMRANPESGDFQETADLVRRQTGKMLEIMLWLAMPNGGLPNIGDTYGRPDWSGGKTYSILRSYLHGHVAPEEQTRLKRTADPFERLTATLAVAEGHAGNAPKTTSIGFPGTGYYVMRSDWARVDAVHLYFDLSAQAQGHAHNDACHFDLYAYGKPLLVDTGDYFLGWGYRTALHNTVEVDGRQQARGAAAEMIPHEWLTSDRLDFVDGAHTGYAKSGIRHRRKILFVKPDYFVLCDLLTGTGLHTYEQFFHFAGPTQTAPAVAVLDDTSLATSTRHEDAANVHVIPAYRAGLRASFAEAHDTDMNTKDKYTREAMLGWLVTDGTFRRVKSPVAVYTREGEAPQCFYDVLFPVARHGEAQVRVEEMPVVQDGRRLGPAEAAGLAIHIRTTKPAHPPGSIRIALGDNLGRGKAGFAEINRTAFGDGAMGRLTDGDCGSRRIGAAVASHPHVPDAALTGRFGVDFGEPIEVNAVILHHGTWNGRAIIYPPETMAVQSWDGAAWRDVAHAETRRLDESVSRTLFDTVRTSRISVAVTRPHGGRLAMREFEAYRIGEDERKRVEALRRQRITRQWTDYVLMSHAGPAERTYGEFAFDGEVALVRKSGEKGETTCLHHLRGTRLNEVRLESGADGPPLRITDVKLMKHPPQKGLAGGQPWAVVSWRTDRPASSQVVLGADGRLDRRTPVDRRLTTRHTVRVEFLRSGVEYAFKAVSVDQSGSSGEAAVR